MSTDPVREHLDTRTEAEIKWYVQFLPNTRQRLLRRAVTPSRPALTPEQVDVAVLRAERELASYRVALLMVESMGRANRRAREERAAKCVTSWSVAFRQHHPTPAAGIFELSESPEHSGCTVAA